MEGNPKSNGELFEANPSLFLEKLIKDFVVESPSNRLPALFFARSLSYRRC